MRHGGTGPPLLLLHGHPGTHITWHRVAAQLAAERTVVCPDLRYGYSSKPQPRPTTRSTPHGALVSSQTTKRAERVINANPDAWYQATAQHMGAEAFDDVRRALRDPAAVHAMCEDYRAGWDRPGGR